MSPEGVRVRRGLAYLSLTLPAVATIRGLVGPHAVASEFERMSCNSRVWSSPVPILPTIGPGATIARFPSIVAGTSRTYVVGGDVRLLDDSPIDKSPLAAIAIGVGSIGRPSGAFTFQFPRATLDSRRRLQLVWGEPPDAPDTLTGVAWVHQRTATLWSAWYEQSVGWSEPLRIYEAKDLRWRPGAWADAFIPEAKHQAFVVRARPFRVHNEALIYFALDADGWVSTPVDSSSGYSYSSIAIGEQQIFLAYAVRSSSGARHDNSVFLRSSTDHGRTWSRSRPVGPLERLAPEGLYVLIGPDSTLHALWAQPLSGGAVAIRHVFSRNAGGSWSRLEDLIAPAGFHHMSAAVDACGDVHVVYEHWQVAGVSGHLDHAIWHNTWSAPEHLFESLTSNGADLRVGRDGVPVLVFAARPHDAHNQTPFATLVSRFVETVP